MVEPTLKSLGVYEQFLPHIEKYSLPFFVVGNKIIDQADRGFILGTVPDLAAELPQSGYIRACERGQQAEMEPALTVALGKLHTKLAGIPRDWRQLEELSHTLHLKNADGWAGAAAKQQIDPDFSLHDYALTVLK